VITSINSNNSLEYRGLFEEATSDLKNYAKNLLAKINDDNGKNKELLLLFINRFPAGKDFTQDDIRNEDTKYDTLLLQVDSDKGIMWGDMGVANFFINLKDLKNKDFSKVLYTWDCG
jgi:uncharacterized protein YwqG